MCFDRLSTNGGPNPAISVVIAAYNGAAWLPATLASLSAQRFADFEVLVVDDRSTDTTREVAAAWPDPRVRLIALEANGGPVRARNRAVAEARGRYIAALDQDDLCRPTRFARQVAYLERHPETVLVASAATLVAEGGERPSAQTAATTPGLIDWLLAIENPLVWSSAMIRADAARRLVPFTRSEILYAEDFDLYQRLRPYGAIARIDEPLLGYRIHPGGASQRHAARMLDSATRVLAERHRALLGNAAEDAAGLLVAHVMDGAPVADVATYRRLGALLGTIQADHLATARPSAADRRLIRWETARRWARIGRAGLRAGTIGVGDLIRVRPDHLGLGYARPDEILFSGLIGGARRARQTLAAKIIRPVPSRANT